MKSLFERHLENLRNKEFLFSTLWGFFLVIVSLVSQFFATGYANRSASGAVTDIILSNTPVFNVEDFFIYGTILLFATIVALCILYPKRLPFFLKSMAIFTFIRAIFISLTHIDIFPLHFAIDSEFFQNTVFRGILSGRGLFFSGHTGLPYLLSLVFWDHKWLRYYLVALSVFLATVVLLGHIHYSIDVFSAYFITYSIYRLAVFMFKKDYNFSHNEE